MQSPFKRHELQKEKYPVDYVVISQEVPEMRQIFDGKKTEQDKIPLYCFSNITIWVPRACN